MTIEESIEPICGARYRVILQGTSTCTQEPGHPGVHEDDDGFWWPREDQLETW